MLSPNGPASIRQTERFALTSVTTGIVGERLQGVVAARESGQALCGNCSGQHHSEPRASQRHIHGHVGTSSRLITGHENSSVFVIARIWSCRLP